LDIYSYGEEVVIMPASGERKGIHKLIEKSVGDVVRGYSKNFEVDVVSDQAVEVRVPEQVVPQLIGQEGRNVRELEKKLGIGIQVKALQSREKAVNYGIKTTKKNIVI